MLRLLAFVCALAACATPPRPPIARGDFDAVGAWIDERVSREREARDADAVAVVVVGPDRVLYEKIWSTIGAVTLDSRFRVGSISKLLSSLTTLAVRDEGKLGLDDPITSVIPYFKMQSRFDDVVITPRQLMGHKSGLPNTMLRGMYGDVLTPIAEQTRQVSSVWAARPPGTTFLYSDLGFTVLGTVVEAAAGQPFADVVASRLFGPLGMTQSSFVPTKEIIPAVINGAVYVENPPITLPANGAVSSPRDLGRLAQLLLRANANSSVALERIAAEALAPGTPASLDVDFRTGFGINENAAWARDIGPIHWHSGQTPAFTAELIVSPKAGVAVVVMTNTHEAGFLPSITGWEIMATAIEAATGKRVQHPVDVEAAADPIFTTAELDAFAGMYPTEYGAISVQREGSRLVGRAFEEVLDLQPTTKRTFLPSILAFGALRVHPDLLRGIELSFGDVDDPVTGKRQGLFSTQRGLKILRGVKIEPKPLSSSWTARAGHWKNPAQANDQLTIEGADVVVEGGFLMLKVSVSRTPRPLVIPLDPLDDATALTAGIGRFLGETVTVTRDGALPDQREHIVILGYPLEREAAH
ncbi:MAG: serine hydrolase domain-containing protein [Deltaproteobacteria bacterium]|nr:serine hydrolase domain-containing protein [Deltaproteobacteria bacterium]